MTELVYRDPARSTNERVDALIAEMTLREKCWQLSCIPMWALIGPDGSDPDGLAETLDRSPGNIAALLGDDPLQSARAIGEAQRRIITGTRLGIPLLAHAEGLNGFVAGGHAVFPTAIGLAATFSPELVEQMADVVRRDMRAAGVIQALSPNMDVALDPRWGRVHETYGEDPYLAAALSVAFTRGLQGDDLRDGIIATAKHFVGYSVPQGGINLSGVDLGRRRIRDLFSYPFEAAIQLAGLRSVMNSYSTIDGVPAGASREILTDLLRDELGFDGFVTSDYTTLNHMVDRQWVARDPAEAGRLAIAAGLDVELPGAYGYGDTLVAEIEAGRIDAGYVDDSVRRVLAAKFDAGLFENPYPPEAIEVRSSIAESEELSRELARRSVVLLRNDGILPIAPGQRLAVVGPHAEDVMMQFPTYTYPALREMIRIMASGGFAGAVGYDPDMADWKSTIMSDQPTEELVVAQHGARTLAESFVELGFETASAPGSALTSALDDAELDRAVALAADADVAVLALGGASLWFNGARTEGEASDSADLDLPAAQVELARRVIATGTPVVVVLVQGRAYTLPPEIADASAIVVSSYNGPHGPRGVAEVLAGEAEPTGALPYSIPRHTGQVPIYHHQLAGTGYRNPIPPGVDRLYLDMDATPLYPFGAGLGYTTFAVRPLSSDAAMATTGSVEIAVEVANTGDRAGVAIPQLYLRVDGSLVARPAQQLGGFARVELAAGARATVVFTVPATLLAASGLDYQVSVDPAPVRWFVGLDSDDRAVEGAFSIEGERRVVAAADRAFLSGVRVTDL